MSLGKLVLTIFVIGFLYASFSSSNEREEAKKNELAITTLNTAVKTEGGYNLSHNKSDYSQEIADN